MNSGYIARMKKEQQDRLAHSSNGYTAHASHHNGGAASIYSNSASSYTSRGRGTYNSSYRGGTQRGAYAYGGRGAASYHPYQRPQPPHGATKFKNRTVVFNKSDASAEAPSVESPSASGSVSLSAVHSRQNSQPPTEPKALCATFTSTGTPDIFDEPRFSPFAIASNYCVGLCTRHGCPLTHDPDKQALCKRWLFKNDCNRGDHCSLSHEPTPHNVPTCLHFQEGRCTNEDCRFAHIRVNPAAQICDAFGRLGYCEKGAECADLHAYECPDFANKGECIRGDKCQHRHVHRASRMRKSTGRSSPEDRSRAASPETENSRDPHDWTICLDKGASQAPHLFTQQVDYVPFDAQD